MSKILSIIIPSYNMERYLCKCLDSLLQTKEDITKNLDIIIINDGSKDKTSDIAHEYKKKYCNIIKIIDKENGNYGSCINTGLNEITGTFVRVLDADDYMDSINIRSFCNILFGINNDVDLIVSDYCKVREDGIITKKVTFELPIDTVVDLDYCKQQKIKFPLHSITYRSEIFKRFKYRQTEGISYTDNEWDILPMAYVRKVYYFPYNLTFYLLGRDGQTMNPNIYRKNFYFMNKIALKLSKEGDQSISNCVDTSREYVEWLISNFVIFVYYVNFFGWINPFIKIDSNIEIFNDQLKEISYNFYNKTEDYMIKTRFYSFLPIKEYRKNKSKYILPIIIHHMYLCLQFIIFKIIPKIKFGNK